MTIIATMQLVEVGASKILAGHGADAESVFVLRKTESDVYELHEAPIHAAEQSLRSFLSADQSELGELVAGILKTMIDPHRSRKPKARRRSKCKS